MPSIVASRSVVLINSRMISDVDTLMLRKKSHSMTAPFYILLDEYDENKVASTLTRCELSCKLETEKSNHRRNNGASRVRMGSI